MALTPFADRASAGRALGLSVAERGLPAPVVLGLPRGGVVVAAAVADELGVPVEVFVARKIGHPAQPEFGLGALAEGGEPVYDERSLRQTHLRPEDLAEVVSTERVELDRRVAAYRGHRTLPPLQGRTVILVDDGVATGVTARAALRALRRREPGRLVLAAPVGAPASLRDLEHEADELVVLVAPHGFTAVGRWYESFEQTSDEEVLGLLRRVWSEP
jgi:putative phosphoribosyl transferase